MDASGIGGKVHNFTCSIRHRLWNSRGEIPKSTKCSVQSGGKIHDGNRKIGDHFDFDKEVGSRAGAGQSGGQVLAPNRTRSLHFLPGLRVGHAVRCTVSRTENCSGCQFYDPSFGLSPRPHRTLDSPVKVHQVKL